MTATRKMHALAKLDHRYLWHPFTQMRDWLKREPILIVAGTGAVLRDAHGREYLDANSSIWTNLHGHNHPKLNAALHRQLRRIAHSSALGLANEPASLLAEKLVKLANPSGNEPQPKRQGTARTPKPGGGTDQARSDACVLECAQSSAALVDSASASSARGSFRAGKPPYVGSCNHELAKVFFSDDGSTAMEVALKLAYQFARRVRDIPRPRFLSLEGAYHGDTVGAVALGHIDLFHQSYAGLLFKSDKVMAPYCYRCRFNRARPERADARKYRQCHWECLDVLERKLKRQQKRGQPYAGFVFEPLVQGAAGIIPQPSGWLRSAAEVTRGHGALLIADEVMTGFGRTGCLGDSKSEVGDKVGKQGSGKAHSVRPYGQPSLFACQREGVQPDFLALAKGLTGGYLPMAATLTTPAVFDSFLGEYEEFKTFFHGHSFTGNQLGAATALASLKLLESATSLRAREQLERVLRKELPTLWRHPNVGDIRHVGLVAGVELVMDWRTREPFALAERAGMRVCDEMARRGVLTRPIGNVIVLMPPYCTTAEQARRMIAVMGEAIGTVFGHRKP